jgi:hypothetical protein
MEQTATFSTHSNHLPCQQVLNETEINKKNKVTRRKKIVSLLADIRLKENEGTQRTLVKVKEAEILIVPM